MLFLAKSACPSHHELNTSPFCALNWQSALGSQLCRKSSLILGLILSFAVLEKLSQSQLSGYSRAFSVCSALSLLLATQAPVHNTHHNKNVIHSRTESLNDNH